MSSFRHQVNLALGGYLGNGVSDEELLQRVARAAKAEGHLPDVEATLRRKDARIEKLEATIAAGEVPPGRYCYVANKRRIKAEDALRDLFNAYKQLADSGDSGVWRAEDTLEGRAAMKVLGIEP